VASTEPKISKLGAAVITRDITLTIPGTREIFKKPGSDTSQCHYGSIKHWIVDHLWYKETERKNHLYHFRSAEVLFDTRNI
jgi:hypothetical protein